MATAYHANNGLVFERMEDGSVSVSSWLMGKAHTGQADGATVEVLDRSWTLDSVTWDLVVGAVSPIPTPGPNKDLVE